MDLLAENIEKLPYMHKVVKESLRIRPPIPFIQRNVAEDTTLGGYRIPKGVCSLLLLLFIKDVMVMQTAIVINSFVQHHLPHVWENPEDFNPER